MSLKEFKLPDIGEGVAEGEIVSWKVAVGDVVTEEQDFVEVMTDKATVTITVPYDGTISEIRFAEGDVVPVETVIAVIDTEGGGAAPAAAASESEGAKPDPQPKSQPEPEPEPAKPQPAQAAPQPAPQPEPAAVATAAAAPASPGKVLAAPATRKRAREAGIDLATVQGTGPSGRVTNDDLERHLGGAAPAAPAEQPAATPAVQQPAVAAPQREFAPVSIARSASPDLEERIPFRGVRKKIAEAMTRSKFTATHFSVVEDLDVTELVKMRNQIKADYADDGVKITYLPFIMKAVVAGLRQFPMLNGSLDETTQEIVIKHYCNLGIATDTDNGLIVPVLHGVERKSIVQLARELQDLAARTRAGKIMPDELRGGTFSITNAGNIGGLFATPIINFPEVAILGVHKIHDAARVIDGEIQIRKVMYLSVSIDHRIVDGADGVRFLNVIKRCLEDPRKLILEA